VSITERIIKYRFYWFLILVLWLALGAASYMYNLKSINHHAYTMASERAKNFFKAILLTRKWNAEYGPVYIPITEQTQPNPYLELPHREITTPSGLQLTMVNPAYMARQISELAAKEKVYFHLTSLNPIRPGNLADPWEKEALKSFHKGLPEKVEMVNQEGKPVFRYMAPLFVEPSCLACHAKQGYRIGDIRGGISVTLDADEILKELEGDKRFLLVAHLFTSLGGILLGLLFLNSARKHTLVLEGITSAQQQDLRQQKEKLKETTRVMHDLVTRDTTTGIHTAEHFKNLSMIMWNNAVNQSKPISLLLLEIDSFNDYTDNYGALEGDICLKEVTGAITRKIQEKGSVVARFGAASFASMLAGMDSGQAYDLAQKIHGDVLGLNIPHETSDVSKIVTITGVATGTVPNHGHQLTEFIKRARDALRQARQKGRNRIYKF
jgi:diguanylate cyclase (GGDEF)-like protein